MKKKFISKLLVLAMTVSMFAGVPQPVLAEEPAAGNATISGTLLDADGTPLAEKTVTLRERSVNTDNGSGRYTATTDAQGKYTVTVPKGVYQVLGFPYTFNSAKQGGTARAADVCAVAQVVTADDGAQVELDLQVPTPVTLPNGEFDSAFSSSNDWTLQIIDGSDTSARQRDKNKDRHSGNGHMNAWHDKAYQYDISQKLSDLEAGTYTLQISAEAGLGDQDEGYIYVKDESGQFLAKEEIRTTSTNQYEVFALTVDVTDEPITVGISSKCGANANGGRWINADEFRMGKLPEAPKVYTKAELQELLAEANTKQEADYTKVSFAALTTAKTSAQSVYDKADAKDSEITGAYTSLQKAMDNLRPARKDGDANYENDTFWLDEDGNVIYSQGGGIFKFDDKYYWYGVKYEEAEKYAADPTTGPYSTSPSPKFLGVTCYSSDDLATWKYEGIVVKRDEVSGKAEMNNQEVAWVGRLGVAKVGGKYALLVQHECPDADNSLDGNIDSDNFSKQVLVLTCDTPNGEFKWNQRINMKDYTGGTPNSGDQTVFTDDDGTSYLVYSYGSGRGRIFLSKIVAQADGKIGLAKAHKVYQGTGREGNCMFKYNGKYYVCASDLYGWNASHAYYMVLDSLKDEYLESEGFNVETNMKLMAGSSDDFCHVTQTGFFYTVQGSEQETVIFCGDRWSDFAKNGLGYNQWCPLSFKADGTPYFNSLSAWDLDVTTGRWEVHDSNNYVKNGSFDADRVKQTELAGWTNTINKGTSPINNNGDVVTGKYALKLGDSVAFDCKVSQKIEQNTAAADAVQLPNGTYDLKAKVKNSGTFAELSMYVTSGSLTKKIMINTAHAGYTEITLPDVTVSGNKAEIGFIAVGNANASALIDDVSFVLSKDQEASAGKISCAITSDAAKKATITAASADGTIINIYEIELAKGTKTYTLEPVAAGSYTVDIEVKSGSITGGVQTVTVAAGQTAAASAITVTNQAGNVTGKIVDENGQAVEGATVSLVQEGQTESISAKTAADGTYTIDDVRAGTYTVQVEKEGYGALEETTTVTVTVGETAKVPNLAIEKQVGTVTGKVYDQSGAPISGASVALRGNRDRDDDRRFTTQTGADGTYTIDVPAGSYQVMTAQANASVQAVADMLTVEAKKSYTVDLTLPKTVNVPNGDFERNFSSDSSWTYSGGKWTERAGDVISGNGGFNMYNGANDVTAELHQTLRNLRNGTYMVNIKAVCNTNAESELYIYAKDSKGQIIGKESIPNTSDDMAITIGIAVHVTDKTLTIGLSGVVPAAKWSHVDDFFVGRVTPVTGDAGAAEPVMDLIDAIGTVSLTDASKAKLDAAREAYDKLTAAQMAFVDNSDILVSAEKKYEELVKEQEGPGEEPPVENTKIDISKATVAAISAQTYTGKKLTPAVKVTYEKEVLVKGTDYTLSYSNNKNIGTAKVTIIGIGNYEGSASKQFTITVKKNKVYTVGSYQYKITNAKTNGKGTVAVAGGKSKSLKSAKIGATVKIGGKSFKITSIAKSAFKGYKKLTSVTIGKNVTKIEQSAFEKCTKLKTIKISSTSLKSVGKNAIKGINKKAAIKCPKKKAAKYKKLFKSSTGYKKTMKIS